MINYNVVPLDITNGLNNREIASSFNYLMLLEAPSNANVRIRLNDNTADEIPLKANSSIQVSEVTKIFISADSVIDGRILIGQANTNQLKINPTPNIARIEEIAEFGIEAKTVLQFLPTDSFFASIDNATVYDLDIKNIKGIKFIADGALDFEIQNNGVKYPIVANEEKEIYTHFLQSLKFHNNSGATVKLTGLVMGNLNIDLGYVEDGYVLDGYVL